MDEISKRARAVGISPDNWPYGPNVSHDMRVALLGWAEHYGLRIARSHKRHSWLMCYGKNDPRHHNEFRSDGCCPRRWFDHVTCWNRNGKPALLLSQPYGISDDARADINELRLREDVIVQLNSGWYAAFHSYASRQGYGTTAVEVWSRQVWAQIEAEGIKPYIYPVS